MRKERSWLIFCTIPLFTWGADKSHGGPQLGYAILVLKFGTVRSEILDLDVP
jgi:hypothetical protein